MAMPNPSDDEDELKLALLAVNAAFADSRLRPQFAARCSPLGERHEIARRIEAGNPSLPDLAIYCFKAMLTMGDVDDFLALLPAILAAAVQPGWQDHTTNFGQKIVDAGFADWPRRRKEAVTHLFVAFWKHALAKYPGDIVASMLVEDIPSALVDGRTLVQALQDDSSLACACHVAEMKADASVEQPEVKEWLSSDEAKLKLMRALPLARAGAGASELEYALSLFQ